VFSAREQDQHYDGYFGYERIEGDSNPWFDKAQDHTFGEFGARFLAGRSGRLLDIGCGLGLFVRYVANHPGWQAVGCETSRVAVDYAARKLGLNNVFLGRVEDAGFEPASFDIITLWDVIEHVPDPDPLLAYIARLLKPDGLLFIHTPNAPVILARAKLVRLFRPERPGDHFVESRDHVNIYAMPTLSRVLRRNGFNRVEFLHFNPGPFRPGASWLLNAARQAWFRAAQALFALSCGRVNIEHLAAVARK
jgi:SAM-dependent methyltransferase